jgi:hypothetical protein
MKLAFIGLKPWFCSKKVWYWFDGLVQPIPGWFQL